MRSYPVKCKECGSVLGSLQEKGHLKRIHKITTSNPEKYFSPWKSHNKNFGRVK